MTYTLILYILRFVAALLLPAAAFVYVRTKFSGKTRNFFDGAAVYFIFYCLIYAVVATYLEMFTTLFEDKEYTFFHVAFSIVLETLCVAVGYLIWFKAAVKKEQDNGVGLMAGVGFSSLMLLVFYALPSAVNAVITVMYMSNPEATVSVIFEENVNQVGEATTLGLFYDLLIMICVFVLETAFAAIFYRVLRCKNRKIWLLAAVILRIAAYIVRGLTTVLNMAVIVIIFAIITLVALGAIYSLIKPFTVKKEE